MFDPKIGDVVVCQNDILGLVLKKKAYHDGDGIIRTRYSGICIGDVEKNWETIKPKRIIGTLPWIVNFYINS